MDGSQCRLYYPPHLTQTQAQARAESTTSLFDKNYGNADRPYWWSDGDPLSLRSSDYTSLTVRAFLELLENGTIKPDGIAIDVGSAEGRDAARLAKLGYWTTGLELSARGIQASHNFVNKHLDKHARRRVEYFRRELFDWPMAEESFDLVWFRGVIDYLLPADKERAIRRLQDATKIGGIFVVHTVIDHPDPLDTPPHQLVPLFPDINAELTNNLFSSEFGWEALKLIYEWHKPHDDPVHKHSHFNGIYRKVAGTPLADGKEIVLKRQLDQLGS